MAISRINVVATLADLKHDMRLARNCSDAQTDRLDRFELKLDGLIQSLVGEGVPVPVALGASPVAHNLYVQAHPDGSAHFSIDGGDPFYLAPRLTMLFQFLASGDKDRSDKDELVGWRSRIEIVAFLEKHGRKRITMRYVNHQAYLLREALEAKGHPRELIQTSRKRGVRLALISRGHGPPHPGPHADSTRS